MDISIEFKVLVASGSSNLSFQVNNHLRDGWELQGGTSVTNYYDKDDKLTFQYVQAICKESDEQ